MAQNTLSCDLYQVGVLIAFQNKYTDRSDAYQSKYSVKNTRYRKRYSKYVSKTGCPE